MSLAGTQWEKNFFKNNNQINYRLTILKINDLREVFFEILDQKWIEFLILIQKIWTKLN